MNNRPEIKFEYLEQGMGASITDGETETTEQFAKRIEERCNVIDSHERAAAPTIVMTVASPKGRLIASLQSLRFKEESQSQENSQSGVDVNVTADE